MDEVNRLWLLLDDYDESLPGRYLDAAGELSVETLQRMAIYLDAMLARPDEVAALEEQWQDWWPLVVAFTEVYAPDLRGYRALSPLRLEAAETLSPGDVRYLREFRAKLAGHLATARSRSTPDGTGTLTATDPRC